MTTEKVSYRVKVLEVEVSSAAHTPRDRGLPLRPRSWLQQHHTPSVSCMKLIDPYIQASHAKFLMSKYLGHL